MYNCSDELSGYSLSFPPHVFFSFADAEFKSQFCALDKTTESLPVFWHQVLMTCSIHWRDERAAGLKGSLKCNAAPKWLIGLSCQFDMISAISKCK